MANNLYLIVSAAAFFLLTASPEVKSVLITLFGTGLLCIAAIQKGAFDLHAFAEIRENWKKILIAAAIVVLRAEDFYSNWIRSSKAAAVANVLGLPLPLLVAATAAVLAVAAAVFLVSVLGMLGKKEKTAEAAGIRDRKAIAICILTAVGVITVCSKSSFLYPLNDWVDANCFFTVGKSMMHGVVMYRDLWEQKGPFLYFLHALAWLISHDSFLGVYLIETVACAFFLYFSYKTIRLFTQDLYCLLAVPVAAVLIYIAPAFCHGDSAEELSLPFLACALWLSMRAFADNREMTLKEHFVVGIGAGLVFWTKFTLVGFYIGWFVMPALLLMQKKQWKRLCRVIGTIAAGVFVSTIPFILYFGMNHAILDWLEVYLYDNLFLYTENNAVGSGSGILANLAVGLAFSWHSGYWIVLFTLLGGIWFVLRTGGKTAAQYCLSVFFTFAVVFIGGRQYDYYPFVLAVFVPCGVSAVVHVLLENIGCLQKTAAGKWTAYILVILCTAAALYMTPNRYLMGVKKEEMPQYQFKAIIEQKEDATLLNYGFLDGGFYTVCEIVPNCKAFAKLNIPLTEMKEMQETYVREGRCDFVVTKGKKLQYPHYDCVAQSQFPNKFGEVETYYLYQLKS